MDRNIFVMGIRRSGNHAIANGLFPQIKDFKYFNDHRFPLLRHTRIPFQQFGNDSNAALIGLENQRLKEFFDLYDSWEARFNNLIGLNGDSKDVVLPKNNTYIVIIRNPGNVMASQFQGKDTRGSGNAHPDEIVHLGNEYYNNYINNTYPEIITIFYDKGFIDENYRKEISNKLNLEFSDENLQKVHGTGNGSSFNRTRYDGAAQKMNVLKRYEEMDKSPEMQIFIQSEDGIDLKNKGNNICDLENINLKL